MEASNYTLATDSDFEFVLSSSAPNTYSKGKGYYKYIGKDENIEIPASINGEILKDYYNMFYNNTTVKGVSSDNPNVTSMNSMFSGSKVTSLDLSSFNTSNVTDMNSMFQSSEATIGYARTITDANKFNASGTSRPSGLTFVVK